MKCILIIVFLASAAVTAAAQAQEATPAGTPGFTASIFTEFSYDDNFLNQLDSADSSRIWLVNPRLGYAIDNPTLTAAVQYDFAAYHYLDSQNDSYERHSLALDAGKQLNSFNKFDLQVSLVSAYEPRGMSFNEATNIPLLSAPTKLDTRALTGNYQLGADTARIRVIGTAGWRKTARDSPLVVADSRDFEEDLLGLQVLYQFGWRTDLVAEYRQRDIGYTGTPLAADGSVLPLDSKENYLLAGIDLRASARTSGKLRIGTLERDFKTNVNSVQNLNDSGADFFWELTGVWAPLTYSIFTFNTRVSTRETLAVGSFVRSKEYILMWSHRWKPNFNSEINFSKADDEFMDFNRTDNRKVVNVSLVYTFNTQLDLALGMRRQELSSNFGVVGFDKTVWYLSANYRLPWGN